jgi:ribosomal protein S27E
MGLTVWGIVPHNYLVGITYLSSPRGDYLMNAKCENCESITTITLEPYGQSSMAAINCPNCGVSYDTNLDDADIKNLKENN